MFQSQAIRATPRILQMLALPALAQIWPPCLLRCHFVAVAKHTCPRCISTAETQSLASPHPWSVHCHVPCCSCRAKCIHDGTCASECSPEAVGFSHSVGVVEYSGDPHNKKAAVASNTVTLGEFPRRSEQQCLKLLSAVKHLPAAPYRHVRAARSIPAALPWPPHITIWRTIHYVCAMLLLPPTQPRTTVLQCYRLDTCSTPACETVCFLRRVWRRASSLHRCVGSVLATPGESTTASWPTPLVQCHTYCKYLCSARMCAWGYGL